MSIERLRKHVIAALDVDTLEEAEALVEALRGRIERFKIGSRLFTRYGPAILDALASRDAAIFLDLKFHDIPSVVRDACRNAASHEAVFMMTVHAAGGRAMIEGAVEGARSRTDTPPLVVAVTALTSFAPEELPAIGVHEPLEQWAHTLATLAIGAGADGLVCSPHEARGLRGAFGEAPVLVTPGIRLPSLEATAGAPRGGDDQTRIMTPARALEEGSSYLVIGRPLYRAADPAAAADAIAATLDDSP